MPSTRSKPKPPATVSCSGVVISTANATTAIDVNWPTPPGQGQPVLGFIVYRNGTEIASVSAAARVYRDTGAPYETSNSYAVEVVSQSGTRSARRGSNAARRQRKPVTSAPATRTVIQGEAVDFSQWSSDDDTLSYTFTAKPDAGYTINATTGIGTMGATSGNLTFRAVDQAGLFAGSTMAVTVSNSPGPVTARKWNPGNYVKTGGSFYETDQAAYLDVALGHSVKSLDVVTGTTLKGSLINFAWGAINTSGTTYVKTELDRALAWHSANNKKMILQFCWKNFNTSNIKKLVPSDVAAADVVWHGAAWVAAVWRPAIMDRIIATFRWIATNYDAHPALEMVTMSESVTGIELSDPNLPADYTRAAVATQYKRLYTALSESFTKTVVCANVNSLSGEAVGLLDDGYAKGLGHATPDSHDSTGNVLFRGETKGTEIPTMDYRGLRANMQIASDPVLQVGGKDYNGPASKILTWSNTNKVTHLAWIPWGNTTGATWPEVKVAIGANPSALFTSLPSMYEYDGVKVSAFNNAAVGALAVAADDTNWNSLTSWKSKIYVASSPVRSANSNRSLSVYVNQNDPEALAAGAPGLERAEIRWGNPSNLPLTTATVAGTSGVYVATADVWFGWSTYVPAGWKRLLQVGGADDGPDVQPIIQQWHHVPQSGDTENNPWATVNIGASGGVPTWYVIARRNAYRPLLDENTYPYPSVRPSLALGEWTDWVVRVRMHPETGYFKAWKKDSTTSGAFTKVYDVSGGVGFAHTVNSAHFKSGIYVPLWDNKPPLPNTTRDVDGNPVTTVQIYHAQYRVYFGDLATDALGIEYVRPR